MEYVFYLWGPVIFFGRDSGLENSTRSLVLTSASGCKASEKLYISNISYFLHKCQ